MRIGWVSFDVIGRSCLEEATKHIAAANRERSLDVGLRCKVTPKPCRARWQHPGSNWVLLTKRLCASEGAGKLVEVRDGHAHPGPVR